MSPRPLLWLLLALAACAPQADPGVVRPVDGISDPTAQLARSPQGMVSSASTWATTVGAQVLAAGGNAADAAVAASFILSVTEPSMSGLGGRVSIVVRSPDGETFGIDGLNQVPPGFREGAPPGYDRAAVPGVPAAMGRLHREHGTFEWPVLLTPAIELAGEGFPLPADEAARFAGAAEELRSHPSSRAAYLRPDGSTYAPGETFRQPELARTLRGLAEGGAEVFYHGWIAEEIHADMVEQGGFITRVALAGYEALDAVPARGTYRGFHLHSNFRPASGHSVVQALQMLEEVGVPPLSEGADWAAVVGQATGLAIADRNTRPDDDEGESARILTSRDHARVRAAEVSLPDLPGRSERPGVWDDRLAGVGASGIEEARHGAGADQLRPAAFAPVLPDPWGGDHTTHFSVVDADGMMVSVTQSLGPSLGTRLVAPGLGFLYATRLGSEPGSRPSSTIAPTIVLRPDGTPWFALGGAGDARIISAVIQIVSRVVDHGLSFEEAVAAPRVHPGSGNGIHVERGEVAAWTDEEVARLRELGFEPEFQPSGFFGRSHLVALEDEAFLGVAEPRWTGSASGPRP